MLWFLRNKAPRTAAVVLSGLAFAVGLAMANPAFAHKSNEADMDVPAEDATVVAAGKDKFSQRCGFCHGGGGKGGKGPCLTCGRFPLSGNTNTGIYTTIAVGITNRSMGGSMGAFGTSMSADEIVSVIAYMRSEEKRRIAAGEVPDPTKEEH
jgi:mono/diheme cytochrome c family protein